VSDRLGADLAERIVEMYAAAERVLLARLAKALAKGIDGPDWAIQQLATIQAFKRQAQQLAEDLAAQALTGASTALTEAYARGGMAAVADLAGMGLASDAPLLTLPAIDQVARATAQALIAATSRMPEAVISAFRDIITQAEGVALSGTLTRRKAAQTALDQFAARGITGFVDKAGRGWNLASYVEMAMRTGCAKASTQGHLDRLQANGQNLVIVSDAPRSCELCGPFEGQVLAIEPDGEHTTVDEAVAAGLQHPNCRHSLSLYQEGITTIPTVTPDPEGYAAQQEQRSLERTIREQKRVLAVAMDPKAAAMAQAKIRETQATLRAHVASNGLKRQPYREQLGAI
jgi:hypothetical protein